MSSRSSKRRSDGASKSRSQPSSASVSDEENISDVEQAENDSDDDGSGSEQERLPKKSRVSYTNTSAFSMPDDIKKLTERILCCSCGKQLNYMNPGAIRKHPWLKKCYKFLKSGSFTRDDDGIDEQCRWCGDGGRLYGCDYCNHCFCRSCIKRNLGRSEAAKMEDEADRKWHCYLCKPKKISKLTDDCKKILDYIEKEDQKEKDKEERAKKREKEKEEQYKRDREEKVKARKERDAKKESGKLTVKTEVKSEDKDEKTTPRRSLPAPKEKEELNVSVKVETKNDTPAKVNIPAKVNGNHTPDVILVENSPDKGIKDKVPHFQHHRANLYQPHKDGVQRVVKEQNILHVTVGPKKPVVVSAPYKDNVFVPKVNQSSGGNIVLVPSFAGQSQLSALKGPRTNFSTVISKSATTAKTNDIFHMKNAVTNLNVEGLLDRLQHSSKAFSLQMESIKTDIQIAKLSRANMNFAYGSAVSSMKSSIDVMFNSFRDMFNVQFVANQAGSDVVTEKVTEISAKSEVKNTEISTIVLDDDGASDKKTVDKSDSIVDISDSDSGKDVSETSDKEIKKVPSKSTEDFVVEVNEDYDKMEVDDDTTDDKSDKTPTKADDESDKTPTKEACVETECEKIDKEEETNKVDSDKSSSKTKQSEEMETEEETKDSENDKANKASEEKIDNLKEVKDSSKGKTSSEEEVEESKIIESDQEESKSDDILEKSENTAAELELLKEMADEINDGMQDSDEEKKATRKSTRSKKGDRSETENSAAEQELLKEMEEELNEEPEDDVKKKRKSTRSRKVDKKESENSAAEQELLKEMEEELNDDDDEQSEDEVKVKRRSHRSKKQEDKNETENSAAEKELLKEMEEEFNEDSGDDVKSSRRSARSKKQDKKSESQESSKKSGLPKKTEKDSDTDRRRSSRSKPDKEEDSESDDTVEDKKRSKSKSTDIIKKDKSSDKKSEKKSESKKDAKDKDSNKVSDDSKSKEKKSDKSEKPGKEKKKKDASVDDDSDDTEVEGVKDLPDTLSSVDTSSDNDSDDFDAGARKHKGRSARSNRKDLDSSKRETRSKQSKGEKKKAEKDTEEDDSDPEFDRDLEKEIENKKKQLIVSDSESNSDLEDGDNVGPPADEDQDDDDEDTDVSEQLSPSQIKKLKQAQKKAVEEESDFEEENIIDSDMSSDPEVSFPKLGSPKKSGGGGKGGKKKKLEIEELSDDSDFIAPKKKKKKGFKNDLLEAKISDSDDDDSDSDSGGRRKKGKAKGKGKRKKGADSDDSDAESDGGKKKDKGRKRRRIKRMPSSEEEREPGADDGLEEGDDDDDNTPGGYLKRRRIRKVQGTKKLAEETKAAQKAEEERRKRIEERQKEYNSYVEVEGGGEEDEDVPEGTETVKVDKPDDPTAIAKIIGSPKKIPVTTKCVLEMDKETKKPLIEIDRTLVRKLKPHQVAAVRFMFNCCVESVARLKKDGGAGAILAHCMGLGKTLSVITFVHTLLRHVKLTKMTKCLVVCPLNTCLNWVNEFEIWLSDVDYEIDVYEMSKVKQNFERAQMLKEWHESEAGVMILGYDMYRNLVQGSHCKNKKQKKIFYETLADPGPDLVVCDEGHILKNDQTTLSKAMNKIKSQRRVVLTGTPLQNNLGEYHCMVNFVKPNLLGTRKEFYNRFANPITNGQCSDSTPMDVKVMKRRAHILHELLDGSVQRKDYSALTKYLPPKFEYVVSVRLSKVQMQLYEKYLELSGIMGADMTRTKGARLFKDYQALMRIWTHPWVMKLDEIRQENKRQFSDSEDSFVDDGDTDEMDSFIDDSSTSNSDNDNLSDSDNDKKKSKKKKGKGKKKAGSSSSDDEKKKEDKDEVVKKWTSKRRGNEEGAGSSWMEDMGYGGPKELTTEWWAEFVKEEDEHKLELSGKLMLLFEILKLCEDIGDKVLVFSQSLLSLDIIEDFLAKIDAANQPDAAGEGDGAKKDPETAEKPAVNGDAEKVTAEGSGDGLAAGSKAVEEKELTAEEKIAKELKERLSQFGKCWTKGADYFRMDGSTSSVHRKAAQDQFNDPENFRARLFLISTKAGSLGINLVSANRVIIFDASWNPSHDIQSIFRVYRFGQIKPVYVYRFLAQGTMEEKIYERQVTKQSLSQRVVDEHQIESHYTSSDLAELYRFTPDRLDDPNRKERPLPMLPKDHMLAELMTTYKEWIVTFHEHDSLLENVVEQELTEDEKKAAWEDYENEKKGLNNMRMMGGVPNQGAFMNQQYLATQQMNMQNLLLQGQASLGQPAVLQIVQDLKARFPNLPPEVFQQRVQAVLRQVITNQIMQQSEIQRRQIEQQRMNELNRLNQLKAQIQRQQQMLGGQGGGFNMGAGRGLPASGSFANLGGAAGSASGLQSSGSMPNLQRHLMGLAADQNAQTRKTNTPPPKPK
ncbi:ATRX-like protein [Mya arenaria]|uniref:ATP-dependent helicase ATRX n=1 Tax=Mya arenaria TaxID=6604 RepID=A0ABY7DPR2_MYAAR|nr:ATRX-like protein [Mya arenaria]